MCHTVPMADNALAQAVRAHNAALAAVVTSRERLYAAIADAARDGMRQSDIVDVTGYTREQVRRICRAAGIEGKT